MNNSRHIASVRTRSMVTRGIVTATTLAAFTGVLAPSSAVAEPSEAVAAAAAATIGTTDLQRVEAASVVRLDPTSDVLLLSDVNFIHALWQRARDAGEELGSVRTAAEEALGSTLSADHVRFIVTGIHEAYSLDQQRERDQAEIERAAKLAKSQALLAVGIPSTPELLGLSDDNFIREVAKHPASGAEVRAAAVQALAGAPADWREFIVNGAREAHKRDVVNELRELEERDREEAERRRELAARANAAALYRTTATEAMLVLSDDNFIRELLRIAPADLLVSELYEDGRTALLSPDPAVWKAYIHTGADEAYKRDDENRRKKMAEGNRRLALQIQAAAQNGGVNPDLVIAAKKALAGSDADVLEFLKEDSQYRARRQSLQPFSRSLITGSRVGQGTADGGPAHLTSDLVIKTQADREAVTWVVVPSLAAQPGCYSFESVRNPGYYLKADKSDATGLRVVSAPDDSSAAFRNNATWCVREPLSGGGTSFALGTASDARWLSAVSGAIYATPKFVPRDGPSTTSAWDIDAPFAR